MGDEVVEWSGLVGSFGERKKNQWQQEGGGETRSMMRKGDQASIIAS